MNRVKACIHTLVVCLLLSTTALSQQSDNGSLAGVVTDQNKQAVPNASVTVTNLGTGAKRTVTTNEEGRWTIVALPLGEYQVSAEAENSNPPFKKCR